MSNDYLSETLNANPKLLQDLSANQYLQNEFLGMLKSIETIIPEDSRENFYKNLKTLRIKIDDTTQEQENAAGLYSGKTNEICINKSMLEKLRMSNKSSDVEELKWIILSTMYHELLHMASTTRDEKTGYYASGFQHIESENGEFLYAEEFKGMTEGFVEKLTVQAFRKETFESDSEYGRQMNLVEHLSELTDSETMKRAFFNNRSGMKSINKGLEELDGKESHIELYQAIERDFRSNDSRYINNGYEDTLLFSIEKKLLDLSSEKIKKLLEKKPTMNEEEVNSFWMRIAGTVNFPEKLELMGEDSKKYKGIECLRDIFMLLRQATMQDRNKKITVADVEKATVGVPASAINNNTHEIKNNIHKNAQEQPMDRSNEEDATVRE